MTTRERILDAAAEIMRTDGIGRATTKAIAAYAGCSEAALYKHFSDKAQIFLSVLHERLPNLGPLLQQLDARIGRGSVRGVLSEVTEAALAFYDAAFPLAVGIFSERRLLEDFRTSILKLSAGPRSINHSLAAYVKAEQDLGRISASADPDAVASLLMGACFQHAFFRHFYGESDGLDLAARAASLVEVVADGIITHDHTDGHGATGRPHG